MIDKTKGGRPFLPVGRGIDRISEAFDEVFSCVNAGTISVQEALTYVTLLEKRYELTEAVQIEKRIRALEADDA
jgi:hypothetical protein